MRRAVPVIVATAGGLALLASFKTSPASPTVTSGAAAPDESTTTSTITSPNTTAGTSASTTSTTTPATPKTTPTTAAPRATTTTTTAAATQHRSIDGPDVRTRYGDVRVRIIVTGHHIDDVQALALPQDRERSAEISDEAGPQLRSEALKAQSADIDIVSGATYTSDGYIRSLQGAIDANH